MKYNININQRAVIEHGFKLDLVDCALIGYFKDFSMSNKIQKILIENEIYYWINYQEAIKQLPLININNTEVIGRRFKKLTKQGILKSFLYKKEGNKTFFAAGENFSKLYTDESSLDYSKIDTIENLDLGYNKGSNNLSTQKSEGIDSKVERVSTQQSEPTDSKVETLSTQKSDNNIYNNYITNNYTKNSKKLLEFIEPLVFNIKENYGTDFDFEIFEALVDYFDMRIKKNFSVSVRVIKSKLKRVFELSRGELTETLAIIDKATSGSYLDFYELNDTDKITTSSEKTSLEKYIDRVGIKNTSLIDRAKQVWKTLETKPEKDSEIEQFLRELH